MSMLHADDIHAYNTMHEMITDELKKWTTLTPSPRNDVATRLLTTFADAGIVMHQVPAHKAT